MQSAIVLDLPARRRGDAPRQASPSIDHVEGRDLPNGSRQSMLNCPKCGAQLKLEMGVKLAEELRTAPTPPARLPQWPEPQPSTNLGALLMRINDRVLKDGERQFVSETRERFKKYGAKARLSDKQLRWLERIAQAHAA